jgi:hypothetical protein
MNLWQRYISECQRMDRLLQDACGELCSKCDVFFDEASSSGCCGYCHVMDAYRDMSSRKWLSPEAFEKLKIKYRWDDVYGFLDLNKGCKIPRIFRADICLTFMCMDLRKRLGDKTVRRIDKIIGHILYDRYNCNLMKIIDENAILV